MSAVEAARTVEFAITGSAFVPWITMDRSANIPSVQILAGNAEVVFLMVVASVILIGQVVAAGSTRNAILKI